VPPIVAGDPERVTPAELRDMPVFGTLLAGRWAYQDDPVL
jgi:hypothetical protein